MANMNFEELMKKRPHIVILGAGASCAAIPNGDRNGKKISTMNGFIESLGLTKLLSKIKIFTNTHNLEDIFMELDTRSEQEVDCANIKNELERIIFNYMAEYEIPDEPTVYDFLVLSLTDKDLIATFNWDPLLVQAYCRAMEYTTNLPFLVFLHGNVAIGYCEQDNVIGRIGLRCKCGKLLKPIKLLYPIKKKNYNDDIAISKSWKELEQNLKRAYMVTIFGYSAPKSDVEAINAMKQAWGNAEKRSLEEIEFVDIRTEDEVIGPWRDFIHTHHYSYHKDFFSTALGRYPRRSCEAIFDMLMGCRFLDGDKGFKTNMTFQDINSKIMPLVKEEDIKKKTGETLNNPYV